MTDQQKLLNNMRAQLREQIIRGNELESQLVDAKMRWADLDMENDELVQKMQQKNQTLKFFSSQVTKIECELVQSKQQLGDAMNHIYELENIVKHDESGNMYAVQSNAFKNNFIEDNRKDSQFHKYKTMF